MAVSGSHFQSFVPFELRRETGGRATVREGLAIKKKAPGAASRRHESLSVSYGAGVGAASMVLVVVDVVVVASGVPEGAVASWVLVVSVVVVVSVFWQPADVARIPAASNEPRTKSFFMTSAFNPCGGAPRSSWPCCRRPTS